MKKCVLIVLTVALSLLSYFYYLSTETALLPEVKKILEMPPLDEKDMAQNSYVYLFTIDAKDDNYFDIAKKYIIANDQWVRERIKNYTKPNSIKLVHRPEPPIIDKEQNLIVRLKSITTFPCLTLNNEHCVKDILNQSSDYVKAINGNNEALSRYEYIVQLPNFTPLINSNISFLPVAPYQYYAYLSNLEVYRAISFIDNGNISEGLDILRKEIDFAQKLYVSSSDGLAQHIGVHRLLSIYHTVSVLLNQYPSLTQGNNLLNLRSLLSIFPTQEQLNLTSMMTNARDARIYELALLNYTDLEQDLMKYTTIEEKLKLKYQQFLLTQSLNKVYLAFAPYTRLMGSSLSEISNDYINTVDRYYTNDEMLFLTIQYVYKKYNVKNYLALVNLQLDILSKGLKADQVPDFLASSGDKALNIISQQPFVWNKENATISTDYLTLLDKDRNPMSVKIKFNQ